MVRKTSVRKHPRRTKKGRTTVKKHPRKCPGSKIRSKGLGRGMGIGRGRGPIGIPVGAKNYGYKAQSLPEDVREAIYYLDMKKHPEYEKESERVLDIIKERSPRAVSRAEKMMMMNLKNFASHPVTGKLKPGKEMEELLFKTLPGKKRPTLKELGIE